MTCFGTRLFSEQQAPGNPDSGGARQLRLQSKWFAEHTFLICLPKDGNRQEAAQPDH